MDANDLSRELFPSAGPTVKTEAPAPPRRTLIVRTPRRTYGLRYGGLLEWEGTESVLVLHFTRVDVVVHGRELLKTYAGQLAEDLLSELVEPQRGDRFGASSTGSKGVEKIEVVFLKRKEALSAEEDGQ